MSNTRTTLSCRYLQSTTSASYFIPFFLSSSFLWNEHWTWGYEQTINFLKRHYASALSLLLISRSDTTSCGLTQFYLLTALSVYMASGMNSFQGGRFLWSDFPKLWPTFHENERFWHKESMRSRRKAVSLRKISHFLLSLSTPDSSPAVRNSRIRILEFWNSGMLEMANLKA